jgi:3-oxoadipate enol-lactonase
VAVGVTTVALHHVIDGPDDGPPLLLGASLGTSTEMWTDNVAGLSEHHRVIRYDHRGQGRSPEPPGPYEIADLGRDVLALLDALGIERAAVGGVSLGGMIAMWLGAHAPERVDRVIAACTSAYMADAPWAERVATVLGAGSTEPIADAVVDNWLTPDCVRDHPDKRERLRALLVASPAEGYAACCGAIERMDLRDDIARIEAPTLVVSGSADGSTPREHQELIAARIPGARHETIAPGAHLSNVEQPAAFNALVLEHLR